MADFEANMRAFREQEMQMRREDAKRKSDAAIAEACSSVMFGLAQGALVAATFHPDAEFAGKQFEQFHWYSMAGSMAFMGPEAVLKFLEDTK